VNSSPRRRSPAVLGARYSWDKACARWRSAASPSDAGMSLRRSSTRLDMRARNTLLFLFKKKARQRVFKGRQTARTKESGILGPLRGKAVTRGHREDFRRCASIKFLEMRADERQGLFALRPAYEVMLVDRNEDWQAGTQCGAEEA
jgi:hypothetical protein